MTKVTNDYVRSKGANFKKSTKRRNFDQTLGDKCIPFKLKEYKIKYINTLTIENFFSIK